MMRDGEHRMDATHPAYATLGTACCLLMPAAFTGPACFVPGEVRPCVLPARERCGNNGA